MDSTERLLKRRRTGGEVVPDSMIPLQLMRMAVRQIYLQRPCRRRYHRWKLSQRDGCSVCCELDRLVICWKLVKWRGATHGNGLRLV